MFDKKEYARLKFNVKLAIVEAIGKCENCGYSHFPQILELAHIQHGKDTDSLRASNLFILCPNCHQEFDRGLISIRGYWSDSKFGHDASKLKRQRLGCWIRDSSGRAKFVN